MSDNESDIEELSQFEGGFDTEPLSESDNEDENTDVSDNDNESDAESDNEEETLGEQPKYSREVIIVKPENRKTSQILSLFERTEIISIRAAQIERHNNCMVDITGLNDPTIMAEKELNMRKCPLTLERIVGERYNSDKNIMEEYQEYWDPNEMEFS